MYRISNSLEAALRNGACGPGPTVRLAEATPGPQADAPPSPSPDPVRPGFIWPGSIEPGSIEPGSIEPGSVQPSSVQPSSVQPSSVQPSSALPVPMSPITELFPSVGHVGADWWRLQTPTSSAADADVVARPQLRPASGRPSRIALFRTDPIAFQTLGWEAALVEERFDARSRSKNLWSLALLIALGAIAVFLLSRTNSVFAMTQSAATPDLGETFERIAAERVPSETTQPSSLADSFAPERNATADVAFVARQPGRLEAPAPIDDAVAAEGVRVSTYVSLNPNLGVKASTDSSVQTSLQSGLRKVLSARGSP